MKKILTNIYPEKNLQVPRPKNISYKNVTIKLCPIKMKHVIFLKILN